MYEPQPKPARISKFTDTTIRAVACGSAHTVALNDKGEAFSWGESAALPLIPWHHIASSSPLSPWPELPADSEDRMMRSDMDGWRIAPGCDCICWACLASCSPEGL